MAAHLSSNLFTLWVRVSTAASAEDKADIGETLNSSQTVIEEAAKRLGIMQDGSEVDKAWKSVKESVQAVVKGGDGSSTWEAVDNCFKVMQEGMRKKWPDPCSEVGSFLHLCLTLMSTASPGQPMNKEFLQQFVEVACELDEDHFDELYRDYIAATNELILKGMMEGSLSSEDVTLLKDRLLWQVNNFLAHFISYTEPAPGSDLPRCHFSAELSDPTSRFASALPGEIPLSQLIAAIKAKHPKTKSKSKRKSTTASSSVPSEGGATSSEGLSGSGGIPGKDEIGTTEQIIEKGDKEETKEADEKDQDSEKAKKQVPADEKDQDSEKEEKQVSADEKDQDSEREEKQVSADEKDQDSEREEKQVSADEKDQGSEREEKQVSADEKDQDSEREEKQVSADEKDQGSEREEKQVPAEEKDQDSEKEQVPAAVETPRDAAIEAKAVPDSASQAIQPIELSDGSHRVKVSIQAESDDEEATGQEPTAMKEVDWPEEDKEMTAEQYQALMDSLPMDDAANLIIQVSDNLEQMWSEDVNEVRGFLESKEGISSAIQKRLELREMKLLEELEIIKENRQQAKEFLDFRSGSITTWPVRPLKKPPNEDEQQDEAIPLQKVDPNVLHDILHRVANPVGHDTATSDHAKQVLQAWYILLPEFSHDAIVSLAKDLNIETEGKGRPALLEAITTMWSSQDFHTSSDAHQSTVSHLSSEEITTASVASAEQSLESERDSEEKARGEKEKSQRDEKETDESEKE